jgi:hypothetical protein
VYESMWKHKVKCKHSGGLNLDATLIMLDALIRFTRLLCKYYDVITRCVKHTHNHDNIDRVFFGSRPIGIATP